MNPHFLRQCVKRYSTVGLIFVSISLVAWHLWSKKRVALVTGIVVFLVIASTTDTFSPHSVSYGNHWLYIGQIKTTGPSSPHPIEVRLLQNWDESSKTNEVRELARGFALSIEQQKHGRANDIGKQLSCLFRPDDYLNYTKDGKWLFSAILGQIYLEQLWVNEAEREFQRIRAVVPPGEEGWGKSFAREIATYGLARTSALRGSYGTALKWLADAPDEYNGGCGNANEAEAVNNYPVQVVWTTASKPSPVAVSELRAIMSGHFTPMESGLNGDTSEAQRQHAAVEAGLVLGCLYAQKGQRADAEACWKLVSSRAGAQHEASTLAQAMLGRFRHD